MQFLEFWYHSKQHDSKTKLLRLFSQPSFGTILNNMTLKRRNVAAVLTLGFGTILNNMTLKLFHRPFYLGSGFGTILNNMTLKL